MKRIRKIPNPYNYSFTVMYEEFPPEFLEELGAPGKFVKKANPHVKLSGGKTGEMDAPYVADPDGITLFERAIVILEHQRYAINKEKSYMISNYIIQGVADEKLPFLVAVASHLDKDKHMQEFERTESFVHRLVFLDLGERDNWERLYNVRNKLRFNKNLSVKDGLNLAIVVLFAPEDCAMEITREALHYLLESKIESKRLEYVLYSVFYSMIDAYCNDEKEFNEMITMLNQKTSSETKQKYASELRRENRLRIVEDEKNEITKERNQAYDLINILLSNPANRDDPELKKKIRPFEKLIKKCNA